MNAKPITVLMADDDEDEHLLLRELWEERRLANDLRSVKDGEELMAYLRHEGRYAELDAAPKPDLILLDLNMPKLDGREALREIRADRRLRDINVIVLTSSREEQDFLDSYDLGVDHYLVKPVTFDRLLEVLRTHEGYSVQLVKTV